ncbi:hypothetical protein BH11CYA1_BH11CYA1_06100 [soil metagenome]
MGKHYRQGDVLIEAVEQLPASAIEKEPSERIILALSETTGHTHYIASSDARAFEAQGMLYLEVLKQTELQHDEHAPLKLLPGLYRVRRQREYLPEGPRIVRD